MNVQYYYDAFNNYQITYYNLSYSYCLLYYIVYYCNVGVNISYNTINEDVRTYVSIFLKKNTDELFMVII